MRRPLTDAFLRTLKPPAAGRLEVWDDRTPGLCLRVTSRAMTWAVRGFTAEGKRTRVSLGRWPAVTLAEARRRARETLGAVAAGHDPVAEKRQMRARRKAEAAEPSVAERLAQWQEARAGRWSARHAREVARVARHDILPTLGSRRLRETTREHWTGLVEAKRRAGAPAMAALLYRVASAFLNFAEAAGWIDRPLLPRKGAATLAPPPAPRDRVLTDAELRSAWDAAGTLTPKARAFVRLLILTAAREAEVAGIMAGEVDLAAGLWHLPAARAKNGRALTIPLGDLALAELRAVWPDAPAPDDCILGRFAASPLAGFSKIKAALDAAMAAAGAAPPPWRLHDLRRTARSGMARLGVPNDHAEAALNHVSGRPGLARIYDRHDYAREAAEALRTWQAYVAGLVGQGAEVVALAERRRSATL